MVIMTNALLQKSIPYEEFDYQTLLDATHGYAQPRMKISGMLAKGDIVRVKKGLYILGESLRRQPFCRELLANLIYVPRIRIALSWPDAGTGRDGNLCHLRTVTDFRLAGWHLFLSDDPAGSVSHRHGPS